LSFAGPLNGTVGATTATTGAFTTGTFTDVVTITKSGASARVDGLTVTNANAGTAAVSSIKLSNGSGNDAALVLGGTGYTSYGVLVPNAVGIYSSGTAGAFIASDNAAGHVKIGVGASIPVVADFSSTGLAVTGTLSATDDITVTANSAELYLNGGSSAAQGGYVSISRGGTPKILLGTASNVIGGGSNTSDDLALFATAESRFYASSTEKMRLTSTGLGIGTSSPAYKLTIDDAAGNYYPIALTSNSIGTAGNFVGMRIGFTGTTYQKAAVIFQSADGNGRGTLHLCLNADATSANATLSDSRLQLDYSGNLGLGVTPSAWSTFSSIFEGVGYALSGFSSGANVQSALFCNAYFNGTNYIYRSSAAASEYLQISGQHQWFNAPSGTAGNPITFTQAMTLDASGNLGIGTSSPTQKLVLSSADTTGTAINIINTSTGGYNWNIFSVGSSSIVGNVGSLAFRDSTNGVTRMTLDSSGNLLVGATTPYTAAFTGISVQGLTSGTGNLSLGLNKAGTPQILSGDVLGNIYFYGVDNDVTAGNNNIGARIASIATTDWTTDGTTSNAALVFYTHGTTSGAPPEAMRLDSSGNLGLGVTPSAWYSTYRVLEGASGALYFRTDTVNDSGFMANSYRDASAVYRFKQNGAATYYSQGAGAHQFFTSTSSGTAGNAITFTQAMTLDASGNLGIGTTSPATKLDVGATSDVGISMTNSSSVTSGNRGSFQMNNSASSTVGLIRFGAVTDNVGTDIQFYTRPAAGSLTQTMTLDSSGNLLVGTTSSYGGERVTIDFTGSSQRGVVVRNTTSTTQDSIAFVVNSTFVGWISASTTATSYNSISDHRLKENVVPMTGALATVAKLKPVTYKWKLDGSDGQGFIAHELAEVCPQAVSGEKDAVNEDGSIKSQGIDTSFLVATLTAAIQEQQALITQLTARVAQLESKP
jgi:hypothetical protein